MYPLRKTFLRREKNSSWLNKFVRRLSIALLTLSSGNYHFPGINYKGKPPNNGTEYFNHRLKSNGRFWIAYQKMLDSVRIMSLFSRVRAHLPIKWTSFIFFFDMTKCYFAISMVKIVICKRLITVSYPAFLIDERCCGFLLIEVWL